MTDKIRWGILSTGLIAGLFTEDLRRLPDAEVTAVGSRTAEAAQAFADRYGIARAHGSWAELAADPDVDIVYIANTNNGHYAAAELCLNAGKAVLCEKPFTLNAAEARALMDLAAARGCFLMEAMWMRCNPAIRRMSELIADGTIGQVRTVQAEFCVPGPFASSHRLRDPRLGGGALLDLGVYLVSFAHLILGAPTTISAIATLTPEGVDENTGILLGYAGGAIASLTCGIGSDTPANALAAGPLGHIAAGPLFFLPSELRLHRADAGPEIVTIAYQGGGMGYEAAEAMRCLREGLLESPLVPWRATLEVMQIMDTVRQQIGVSFPGEAR
ncbi:MAG: Gfo/Idh/MocA family protein [Micromonosporaceae bacterium]